VQEIRVTYFIVNIRVAITRFSYTVIGVIMCFGKFSAPFGKLSHLSRELERVLIPSRKGQPSLYITRINEKLRRLLKRTVLGCKEINGGRSNWRAGSGATSAACG